MSKKTDMSNKSDLVVILTDYDETYAPLDGRAIRISVVSDVAFIEYGKAVEGREDHKSVTTFTAEGSVGVDAEALYESLGSMLRLGDRSNASKAITGNLPADDPAWSSGPVTTMAQGVRRRA